MYLEIAMKMKGRFSVMAFLYPKNVHTSILIYETVFLYLWIYSPLNSFNISGRDIKNK